MSEYSYTAVAQLNDGSEHPVDLEERGWADKELLAQTVRWTLIPKDDQTTLTGGKLPLVTVAIPSGGKPVFRSRIYGVVGAGGEGSPRFRAYGIGYKVAGTTHLTWVLPTGDIECSTDDGDLMFGDLLLRRMRGLA